MNAPPKRKWRSRALNVFEPQTHPVRDKLKDALVAISLANLCFGNAWYGLLDNTTGDHSFKQAKIAAMPLALLMNIAWLAFLFWCGACLVRRSSDRRVHTLGDIALCAAMLVPLEFVRLHTLHQPHLIWLLVALKHAWIISTVVAIVLAAAVLWWHRAAARLAKFIAVICIPLMLFTLTRLGIMLLALEGTPRTDVQPPTPPMFNTIPTQRVVWIIFDEMDQRVTFRQRPPGLHLPELDRLAQESFVAVNAFPPSHCTRISMPALTTGQLVEQARPAGRNELQLTLADGREIGWSRLPNVFSRARDLGFNTALVGWHHPYGRILGASLNDCEWYSNPGCVEMRAPTIGGNMYLQIRAMFPQFHSQFVALYSSSLQKSRSLATDARYGLLLLHLFPPHMPAIYRRDIHQLTLWGTEKASGYLDNLALVDRTLGELRQAMESAGVWSHTWVLVSADHWWRQSRQLDGKQDHRVPFLLKPAGIAAGRVYTRPFCTTITPDLLLAILRGDIPEARDLPPWMDRHPAPPPAHYLEHGEDDLPL